MNRSAQLLRTPLDHAPSTECHRLMSRQINCCNRAPLVLIGAGRFA